MKTVIWLLATILFAACHPADKNIIFDIKNLTIEPVEEGLKITYICLVKDSDTIFMKEFDSGVFDRIKLNDINPELPRLIKEDNEGIKNMQGNDGVLNVRADYHGYKIVFIHYFNFKSNETVKIFSEGVI